MKPRFLFLLVGLMALAAPAYGWDCSTPAVGRTSIADPRHDDANWPPYVMNEIAKVAGRNPPVLFLGDSIIAHWPDLLSVADGSVRVATGGDRTENMLWKIQHGNLGAAQGARYVMLIGTNNIGHDNESPTEVADGISAIIHQILDKDPDGKILLLGLLPRGATPEDPARHQAETINELIEGCSALPNVVYADPGIALLESDGSVSSKLISDGVHPTKEGYAKIMPQLRQLIQDLQ